MLGGAAFGHLFVQHAQRRAAGMPVPVVLVDADVVTAWKRNWEPLRVVTIRHPTAEASAAEYLRDTVVQRGLRDTLSARVATVRAKDDVATEHTPFERGVWISASRDALLARGDFDGHLLLATIFAGDAPSNHLRAVAAASRLLGASVPPLMLTCEARETDAAIRNAIALAEAAPLLPVAVATTTDAWAEWLRSPARSHARAMVAPYVVQRSLAASPPPVVDAQTLVELAKRTPSAEADDDARSAAERVLFDALERADVSRGRFQLNRCLDVRFGNKPLEIDLSCKSPRLAIEVDGYFHFGQPTRYRRDRRKDLVLQREGYLVMRFLAEDVVERLREVVATIHAELRRGIE